MVNHREVIRRLVKYVLMMLIVAFSVMSLIKCVKIKSIEAFYIGLVAATLFAVLDMVAPTICVKHNEQ